MGGERVTSVAKGCARAAGLRLPSPQEAQDAALVRVSARGVSFTWIDTFRRASVSTRRDILSPSLYEGQECDIRRDLARFSRIVPGDLKS